jgi:xylan 1,4-beta-xylosidase
MIFSDACVARGQAHFTGAFVGVACQDMSGTGRTADFDFLEYAERPFQPIPPADGPR